MELPLPLTAYSCKTSVLKTRILIVLFSMVLFTALLGFLQLKFLKPKVKDFYSFEVKDSKGRTVSLEKYRGKVRCTFCFSNPFPFDSIYQLHDLDAYCRFISISEIVETVILRTIDKYFSVERDERNSKLWNKRFT